MNLVRSLFGSALSLALFASLGLRCAQGQEKPALTAEEILKKITYPPEFDATVYASPPDISYPIFLSAAADGTLFVGCDENGSLDRKEGRGRVVMCRDLDGDGKADQFTDFARMDSPRGVAWDASTRTLYVMHPPNLTAYQDVDGTGVSTRQEDLITGLGFGLDFRGADHTINGIRLGIDGWIYIACGDYGAVKATGKDGRSLSLRGGGIVRIRPDGTGLEQVVWGTRNILAVAISPTMELFTRDNTNDGDDWNDRLSFNPFGAQMGYPTLFRNFPDEIVPAMIDFGGGSPVGSTFIDEPQLPKAWSYGFYSVEWGRSEIDLHPLTQHGATWKAETRQFMKMQRPTDLDVDGSGRLYAASWDGATFTYAGPNVGYIIQLRSKHRTNSALPDFKKLTGPQLAGVLASDNATWRFAAQRELLVRGSDPALPRLIEQNIERSASLGVRVISIFTLEQMLGTNSHPLLIKLLENRDLREYALKALGDDPRASASVPVEPLLHALADQDPRVRLQAVTALGHLGKAEAAEAILARTADADFTVAHIAVQALRWLKASAVCLRALDSADKTLKPGALHVLQSLYDPSSVEGLLQRLSAASDPTLKRGIFTTLCRLDMQETPYTDPKMWWGTRPDTSGPIYKPQRWEESDRIEAALRDHLISTQGDEAQALVTALLRMKISFPGFSELMLSKAGQDTASRLDVLAPLASPKTPIPEHVLKALVTIATSQDERAEFRAKAFRLLAAGSEKNFGPAVEAFASLAGQVQKEPLAGVWEEFTRDAGHRGRLRNFEDLARSSDPSRRILGATVLVNIVTSPVIKEQKTKDSAQHAIDRLWVTPEQTISLLEAIGRTGSTQLGSPVHERLHDSNPDVAATATLTYARLGLDKATAGGNRNIADMDYADVLKVALAGRGDPKAGEQLFLKQGCVLCHTVSEKEPPKGPMLGGIALRYNRTELCESILKPSAKIAQGFESQRFNLRDGDPVDGFVVKEGGDSVEVRNLAGTVVIEKADLLSREKRELSIMPEGLVANITPGELASLLAFLESTSTK